MYTRAVFGESWTTVSLPFCNAVDPKAEAMVLDAVPRNRACGERESRL